MFPREPARFEPQHLEALLVFANHSNASDITIQTNEPIIFEIYGRLHKVTNRHLSNSEVGNLLNLIFINFSEKYNLQILTKIIMVFHVFSY